MLKIIQNNPYRFLGVCSNAPVRERLANINRLKAIEADNEIRYSEIKFFKRILACLDISDEAIEKAFPDKEDYFLPDINQEEYEFVPISAFATMKIKL